jgi:hypothetical protein
MTTEANSGPSAQVHVFTSAALNYLPKVRVLFTSLRKYHPEWMLHFLLADERPSHDRSSDAPVADEVRPDFDLSKEPFDAIVSVRDLKIPDWQAWAFCHTLTELATAIKPFMLQCLLAAVKTGDKVIYLDPDIAVFSRLDDIITVLDSASIVLTPHQLQAEQGLAAVIDNEIGSLKHGIYNLGFIGVRKCEEGQKFAEWWSQRCYYFCRDDICNGLFTDQRWIDLVPGLFADVAVLRQSRFNVAPWNITTRVLEQAEDGGFRVDHQPLGFYHFTGFDSGLHRVMAAKNGDNNTSLERLIRWYELQLESSENRSGYSPAWAFANFSNGEPIAKEQRLLYRFRVDLQQAFPDPYAAEGFLKWWQARGPSDFEAYRLRRSQPNFFLTPGYLASSTSDYSPPSLRDLWRRIRHQPRSAAPTVKQGWQRLRQAGWRGWLQLLRRGHLN